LVLNNARKILEGADRDTCIILDVRTPEEYARGHIRGSASENFFSPDFRNIISNLDRDKKYVVYCAQGTRGSRTMKTSCETSDFPMSHISGVASRHGRMQVSRLRNNTALRLSLFFLLHSSAMSMASRGLMILQYSKKMQSALV